MHVTIGMVDFKTRCLGNQNARSLSSCIGGKNRLARNRGVKPVNFGFVSAKQYFEELTLPSHARFKSDQSRGNLIEVAANSWHVHEWLWYEQFPGINCQGNLKYMSFRDKIFLECPEVEWVRDIADAGKHRFLGRPAEVEAVVEMVKLRSFSNGKLAMIGDKLQRLNLGLQIELTDGTFFPVAGVLQTVVDYWGKRFSLPN